MSDHTYTTGPHANLRDAVQAVADAGLCAIARLRQADDRVHADVWTIDEDVLYLSGARAVLRAFAERAAGPTVGATPGYAIVLPPADVACLIDSQGMTETVALGPDYDEDPDARDEIYEGLRAVFDADRAPRAPGPTRAFPPPDSQLFPIATPPPAPPAYPPPDGPGQLPGGR